MKLPHLRKNEDYAKSIFHQTKTKARREILKTLRMVGVSNSLRYERYSGKPTSFFFGDPNTNKSVVDFGIKNFGMFEPTKDVSDKFLDAVGIEFSQDLKIRQKQAIESIIERSNDHNIIVLGSQLAFSLFENESFRKNVNVTESLSVYCVGYYRHESDGVGKTFTIFLNPDLKWIDSTTLLLKSKFIADDDIFNDIDKFDSNALVINTDFVQCAIC